MSKQAWRFVLKKGGGQKHDRKSERDRETEGGDKEERRES